MITDHQMQLLHYFHAYAALNCISYTGHTPALCFYYLLMMVRSYGIIM